VFVHLLSCLGLSSLVLSCLVLSGLVWSGLVLSCLSREEGMLKKGNLCTSSANTLDALHNSGKSWCLMCGNVRPLVVLSWLVFSCLVLSCLVWSGLVLSCLVLVGRKACSRKGTCVPHPPINTLDALHNSGKSWCLMCGNVRPLVVLSWLVFSCLVLSCLVWSGLVWSCLVLSS
jgi:type IV secretory pathway TrbD component